MFRQLIAWALGPSGMLILDWYVDHSLIVNGTLVSLAILAMIFPRQRERVQSFLGRVWAKTPFVISEQDRKAVDRVRTRLESAKRGGSKK
ncbi:MAG TPA: hypothetical protein VFI11_00025 [Anaerolineales bacterium]|nr:hypothetical protein [Anaerolineales bacterium]